MTRTRLQKFTLLARTIETLLYLAAALSLLWILSGMAHAQIDITIPGTNYYTTLGRSLVWGSSGNGAVNNNFIFNPVNPNTTVCMYVTNNNPSNGHSVTITLNQAGDPQVTTFATSNSKWQASQVVQGFPVTVAANSTFGIFFNVTAAAKLVAVISGSTAAGGSPDTADIFAVQTTTGNCGVSAGAPTPVSGPYAWGTGGLNLAPANQKPVLVGGLPFGATGSGVANLLPFKLDNNGNLALSAQNGFLGSGAFPQQSNFLAQYNCFLGNAIAGCQQPATIWSTFGTNRLANYIRTSAFEGAADYGQVSAGQTNSFTLFGAVTNPGANGTILHQAMAAAETATGVMYHNLMVDCPTACELIVERTTALGTTCTTLTPQIAQMNQTSRKAGSANIVSENACTTAPTQGAILYDLTIPAGTPTLIDLKGFYNPASGTGNPASGLAVINPTAITGKVTATLNYSETTP